VLGGRFFPSKHVLEGGWRALEQGKTQYALTNGIPELRKALAEKAYEDYGLRYDSESEI
jgi:aspartate/methionine/tyrosine aminotransferase